MPLLASALCAVLSCLMTGAVVVVVQQWQQQRQMDQRAEHLKTLHKTEEATILVYTTPTNARETSQFSCSSTNCHA